MPENALTTFRDLSPTNVDLGAPDPTFGKIVGASMQDKYASTVNFLNEQIKFGFNQQDEDPNYNARDHIPEGLERYTYHLMDAKSPAQLAFKVNNLYDALKVDETLSRSSFGLLALSEFVDPINYISLPLRAAKTIGGGFRAGAISTGGVALAQEAIRYPIDPTVTTLESGLNIGASAIFGGAINSIVSIPAVRRFKAAQDAEIEIGELNKALKGDGVQATAVAGGPDATIPENIFTDSWIYKSATSPMKRVLTNPNIPNDVKLDTLAIANDSGILLSANKKGQKIGNSVFQNAKLHQGTWVKAYDEIATIWGESTGTGVTKPLDYMTKRKSFEEWVTEIDGKAIRGEKPINDFEARAMQKLNEFYDEWEVRLKDEGLIGSEGYYKKYMLDREARLKVAEGRLANAKTTVHAKNIGTQIDRFKKEIAETKQQLDDLGAMGKLTPPNEDIFRPRYWDFSAIEANRPEFEKILAKWYQSNPETYTKLPDGRWGKVKMSSSPDAIAKRVKDTVDRMLNDPDPLDPDKMFYGAGKSKHFKHRALDIPNRLVLDYMQRNPISIMKAYTQKTSGRYEFSKKFGGGSIDDVLDGTYDKMMDAGASIDEIRAAQKEQRILYDRVVGSVLRRPDAMNQGVARLLRGAAQLSYLGGAVLATITEPAKIVMEHGFAPTMKGLFSVLDKNALKMGGLEIRAAGEALERLLGNVQMRLSEDLNNNPFRGDYLDKATDAFFTLNGLGPVTRILKDFDGMMRSHTLIDYAVRWADPNKKITKMEKEYLLRYNIDEADAKKIAKSNWEKTDSGLYMANTEEWAQPDLAKIKVDMAKTYKISRKPLSKMTEKELLNRFGKEFYVGRIITDQKIVDDVFKRRGYEGNLGLAFNDPPDPATVFVNIKAIREAYNKPTGKVNEDAMIAKLDDDLANGKLTEEQYRHHVTYVKNIDLMDSEEEFINFILMHELHHTTKQIRAGESVPDYEQRIDEEAFKYIRNEKESGLQLAAEKEYSRQMQEADETVQTFRNALGSGVMNTILMGTPADKPTITDGIVYIPMRVASKFGMKEDPVNKGYARIENGMLGLPFQFYSYALAAVNKTMGAYAHGQVKSKYIGASLALGLGYMTLNLKTPDWVEMSYQDKFLRSLDYSGLMPIMTDMFYTGMTTALALGGPNITGGAIQPKFPQKPDTGEAITGILGAGPSYGLDMYRNIAELITGDVGKGTSDLVGDLPFMTIFWLRGTVNDFRKFAKDEIDMPRGIGGF